MSTVSSIQDSRKEFEQYKNRKIDFQKLCLVGNWKIKIYTITQHSTFQSYATFKAISDQLESRFLILPKTSKLPNHQHAFLIIHEARERVWILFSWWASEEMIETEIFFTDYSTPSAISKYPYPRCLVCVWELQVIFHERKAWIKHVLQRALKPNFSDYQKDVLA